MARPVGSKNKIKEELPTVNENQVKNENALFIDNLPAVMEKVKELMAERKLNPGVVQDEDAGVVFINGEPNMVIDNTYFPVKEAQLILQTRKVVREYLKLQNLINNVTE